MQYKMTLTIAKLALFAALCGCTPLSVQTILDINDEATLNGTVTTNFQPCPATLDAYDFAGVLRQATLMAKSTSDNCLYDVQWPYRLPDEPGPTLKSALIKTHLTTNTANSFREKAALSMIHQLYGAGWDTTNARDYTVMEKIDGIVSFQTEAAKFYTKPPSTKPMCKAFMEQLFYPAVADAVEAMVRDYEVQHLDLHGGNYLWNRQNTEAYLIDWESWQYRNRNEAAQARQEALKEVGTVVSVDTVCADLPNV